jgi:hypothetical protein
VGGIISNRFVRSSRGEDKRRILGIGGIRHVHHEIAAAVYHCLLETLHCAQQVREVSRIFIGADFHSFLKEPTRHLDSGARNFFASVRIENLVKPLGSLHFVSWLG